MVLTLGLGTIATVGICVAAIVVSMIAWTRTRPPVLVTGELPLIVRRGIVWWMALTIFFAACGLGWLLLREPLGLPRGGLFRFVPLAFGVTPIVIVNPLYLWRTAWLRRAARATDGRLCTRCAYDVSGLAGSGTCPECGGSFDVEKDRGAWQNLLQHEA